MRSRAAKPAELTHLHATAAQVFSALRDAFAVPDTYAIALDDIDRLCGRGHDPVESAAFAMRQCQLIRRYATPGYGVYAEQFINVAAYLERALIHLASVSDTHAELFMEARDRIQEASWAIVRDTGSPGAGLVELH